MSYEARPLADGTTRLQTNACVSHDAGLIRRLLLSGGDKIMAGRQLRVLKRRAEERGPALTP